LESTITKTSFLNFIIEKSQFNTKGEKIAYTMKLKSRIGDVNDEIEELTIFP